MFSDVEVCNITNLNDKIKTYVDEEKKYPNDNYDGMDIPTYSDTKVDEIKRSNPYVYASIFGLLIVAGGVWYYVKIKGEF